MTFKTIVVKPFEPREETNEVWLCTDEDKILMRWRHKMLLFFLPKKEHYQYGFSYFYKHWRGKYYLYNMLPLFAGTYIGDGKLNRKVEF